MISPTTGVSAGCLPRFFLKRVAKYGSRSANLFAHVEFDVRVMVLTFALSISPMKLVRSPFGVLLVRERHPPDSFDGLSGLCLAFPARYTIPAPPAGHRSKAAQPVFISDEHVGSANNRASTVSHPLCRPPQRRTVAVGRLASARRISATSPPREGDWKRRPVLRQGRRLRRKGPTRGVVPAT